MGDNSTTELVLVLAVMLVLFIFGLAAVVIFWRVWRKERKGDASGKCQRAAKRRQPIAPPVRAGSTANKFDVEARRAGTSTHTGAILTWPENTSAF